MGYRDPYRRYRRYARRSLRHGALPMMLIRTGVAGLIAMAAFSRWAYRHRSAFAPFGITAALFILAAVIHRHHPHYWIPIMTITALIAVIAGIPHRVLWAHPSMKLTTGLISRMWKACGISRTPERTYATAVITACGGWLSAASGIGPAVRPLPAVAVTGTVVLGIPWWAHRRRRARVRALRTMQAWPGLAENMGLPGSRLASIVIDQWGWTGRLILRKGTTAAQAINQLPAIESGLGITPGSARAIPDQARADRVVLRVIERDPHAQPIPWKETTGHATIRKPLDIGLCEDGTPVLVNALRRHILIAGTTGAGKSVLVNGFMARFTEMSDIEPWGIDMKGGMELQPWNKNLAKLATSAREATALLAAAVALLDDRAAHLAARGLRVHEPTPGEPAIEVIIDEFAELPPEALEHADSIARRGRAPAISLLIATQRPSQAAMGGNAVRSQMDARVALRVRERRDADLILGQGALAAGWHPEALTLPGSFLISDPEHTVPMRARASMITGAQIAAHSARHARAGSEQAEPRPDGSARPGASGEPPGAEGALWDALSHAGPDGATVADLIDRTGMTRPTLYRHLAAYARAGRARQVRRGRWHAAPPDGRSPAAPGGPRHP